MSIHLKGLSKGSLGEVTLIVGDPGRVELLSSDWEKRKKLVDSREFQLVTGEYNGKLVSVCSTGIGVGSTEIAVVELIENGAKKIVRCGGCGSWDETINPGEIIYNNGMARSEGMMSSYVPDNYPAVADPNLISSFVSEAEKVGIITHVGVGLTSETYYLGQGRESDISSLLKPDKLIEYWTHRNIINCEMETAVLYILGAIYSIPVANSLVVHVSRKNDTWLGDEEYNRLHKMASKIVLDAIL